MRMMVLVIPANQVGEKKCLSTNMDIVAADSETTVFHFVYLISISKHGPAFC